MSLQVAAKEDRKRIIDSFKEVVREAARWGELARTPYGIMPALTIAAIYFFQTFDSQGFLVAGPEITRDLDVNFQTIIGISAVVGSIGIFAAIGAGYLSDRVNRVRFLGLGTLGSGIGSVASSRAAGTMSLGIPRVVDEVSETFGSVPALSLLADYYPPTFRGRVFAVVISILRVAAFLAIGIVGLLVTTLGWRTTFLIFGAPLIILGLVVLFVLKEPLRGYFDRKESGASEEAARKEDAHLSFGEAWRTVWSVRTLRRLFMADIWAQGGSTVYFTLFSFYLADQYGLNAFARSLITYPGIILGLFGGFLGGGLIDALTKRNPNSVLRVVAILAMISALFHGVVAFGPPLYVLVVVTALILFGSSLVTPAYLAVYSQVIPPNVRGLGLQVNQLAQLPGRIIFLPISLAIYNTYGFTGALLLTVPLSLIGALIEFSAAGFFDRDRRNAFAAATAATEWEETQKQGQGKLLVGRSIDVAYEGVQVLFGVDFDVEEGEIVALLGTNGAGKSTLLKAISGVQEASGGAIIFDGRDITHMPPHEIAARGVIHIPGGRGVFPGLTVKENLLLGRWMVDEEKVAESRLDEVYEVFPILRERANELAGDLSGGEQQMLSLAQGFQAKPRLLMIDELSLGLSPAVVAQLVGIVKEIHARGTTVIVVEQSVNVALTIANRAIFMEKGEVRFVGETAELLRRPDILRAVYVKGSAGVESELTTVAAGERRSRVSELGRARNVLEVENITKHFGGILALNDISLQLREGEVLGVIGPNGSGKTTLFDVISGYQPADSGVVRLDGAEVTTLGAYERARKKLVRRFQDARLFPALTVFENLLVALEQQLEVRSLLLGAVAAPRVRRAERRIRVLAERLIQLLELHDHRDKFVKELSTGLRRVVDIAFVLAAQPKVLLLDEPSAGIAQAEAEGLAPLLRRVRFETGCSILIIEHDMPLIRSIADELVALDAGNFIMRGTPDEVLNDDRVIEAYLGTTEETVKRSGMLQ